MPHDADAERQEAEAKRHEEKIRLERAIEEANWNEENSAIAAAFFSSSLTATV